MNRLLRLCILPLALTTSAHAQLPAQHPTATPGATTVTALPPPTATPLPPPTSPPQLTTTSPSLHTPLPPLTTAPPPTGWPSAPRVPSVLPAPFPPTSPPQTGMPSVPRAPRVPSVPETEKPAILPVPPVPSGKRSRSTPDDDFKPIPVLEPELPIGKPQGPVPQSVVKIGAVSVNFRGLSLGVEEQDLLRLVQSRPGTPYSDEQAREDVLKLMQAGEVTNVQTELEMMKNEKLHLHFVVSSLARLTGVEIRGSTVFTPDVLLQQIVLGKGSATNGEQVVVEARKLVRFYQNDYYTDAGINVTAEPAGERGVFNLTYTVNEGGRNFIKRVGFEGNAHFPSSTLHGLLKPMDTVAQEDSTLQENIRRLEHWYQDQGHVYAKVTEVRRQPLSNQEIEIIFQISEGAKHRISKVQILGGKQFPSEELESCLQIKPGQLYSGSLLVRSEKMLTDYHGARGYAHAGVETSVVLTGDAEVSVSFTITAGEVCRVGKIYVAGNTHTDDAVILRGLDLAPGDLLNAVLLDEHRARLEKLDYFSMVDVRMNPSTTAQEYDIDINVAEKATDLLNFLAGYSSLKGPWLSLVRTESNFSTARRFSYRGDGIDLRLELNMGRKESTMKLKVATKDFFGRPLQLKLPTVGPAPADDHNP